MLENYIINILLIFTSYVVNILLLFIFLLLQ